MCAIDILKFWGLLDIPVKLIVERGPPRLGNCIGNWSYAMTHDTYDMMSCDILKTIIYKTHSYKISLKNIT